MNLRTAFLAVALVSASLTQGQDDQPDMGKIMLDTMKGQPTMYLIALPPDPKVGMWWEHTASGHKMRYAITGEKEGKLIVEQEQDLGGTVLVNAWVVDPTVDVSKTPKEGEKVAHNVTRAFVGLKGKLPVVRPVMDVPVHKEVDAPEGQVDYTEGDETIELLGRNWEAHWVETAGEHASKTWVVKGSYFLLKSTYQGKVSMELTAMGEDAQSSLVWSTKKKD